MSMPTPACTVYFDGACPLCRREIAHYRSQKGAASMAWVDIATSDNASLGADLSRADELAERLGCEIEDVEAGIVAPISNPEFFI